MKIGDEKVSFIEWCYFQYARFWIWVKVGNNPWIYATYGAKAYKLEVKLKKFSHWFSFCLFKRTKSCGEYCACVVKDRYTSRISNDSIKIPGVKREPVQLYDGYKTCPF